jgi:endogenous inhibitor of DNA gyrase (YacG/DUF329 family)
MSRPNIRNGKRKGCPVCGKTAAEPFVPFCSQGCRDRDLLKWLGEGYRVAGPAANEDGAEIDPGGLDSEP